MCTAVVEMAFLMSRSCSALRERETERYVCEDCLKDNLFNSRSDCREDGKSERGVYPDVGVGVGAQQQCGNSGLLFLLSRPV